MSETFQQILNLVTNGEVRISAHGYDELAEDGLLAEEILASVASGIVVEEYPTYHKGPAVLVLQQAHEGKPVHVLRGIPGDSTSPAVLVTAYRPDPERWSDDFTKRKA